MNEKREVSYPKRKRVLWSGERVRAIPVAIDSRDYTARLARIAEALYPYITSSASLEKSADIIGGSISSSLRLPETKIVGSSTPEEVSEYAESKPAA